MAKKNISVGVEIDGSAKGFKSASEDAQKASKKLTTGTGKETKKMGGFFGKLGDKVGGIGGKVGGLMQNIAKGISGAMKILMANPIIAAIAAIIAAIMGLVKIIKSTDSGMTEWNVRMEQLKAVMDQLRQRVIKLAAAMKHLFKGEFKQAAEAAKEAVTGVGDAMVEATRAAREYVEQLDKLQNSQDNFISQASKWELEIEKSRFTAEDASKDYSIRKAAAEKAGRLITELAAQRAKFAQDEYDISAKYLAKKNGLSKAEVDMYINMTDEERRVAGAKFDFFYDVNEQEIIELEKKSAAVYKAQQEEFSRGKELNNQLNSMNKERAAAEQKARDAKAAADAKAAEEAKKVADEAEALAARQLSTEEQLQNQILILKTSGYEKVLEGLRQAQAEELKDKELTEAAKLAIEEKYGLLRVQAATDEAARKKALEEKAIVDQEKLDADAMAAKMEKYDAIADYAMQATEFVSNMLTAAKNQELKAAGDDAKKKEEIEKKYAKKQKAIAIVQALINGALGITKTIATMGYPLAIPFIIASAATTAASIAVIASQSFADGGIVSGPTMGLVGEYSGVRNNPEVIAPLNKLKSLLGDQGGSGGQVTFKIEGTTLVGVLNKQTRKQTSYN